VQRGIEGIVSHLKAWEEAKEKQLEVPPHIIDHPNSKVIKQNFKLPQAAEEHHMVLLKSLSNYKYKDMNCKIFTTTSWMPAPGKQAPKLPLPTGLDPPCLKQLP
jgi:hypothetical protein